MATQSAKQNGRIVQVIGPVVDVEFPPGALPEIYTALRVTQPRHRRARGQPRARGRAAPRREHRALRSRWTPPTASCAARRSRTPATGSAIPVGPETLGRIMNVIGEPVDERGPINAERTLPDPPPGAGVRRPVDRRRGARDRHQGRRPDRALSEGRQDRPVRRRRRRQDRRDHGADQQHRQAARGLLGVRRRGRAHARGQRPLARDDGREALRRHHRARQGGARLRPDERAARRARARRALGAHRGRVLPRRRGQGRAALHRQHLPLHPGGLRGVGAARPHPVGGGLPADALDRHGRAAGADHLDQEGLDHLGAGDLRARRRPHRPGAGDRLHATSTPPPCSRGRSPSSASTPPSIRSTRPAGSSIRRWSARSTTRWRAACSRCSRSTRTCRTSSRSSAWTSSPRTTRSPWRARASSSASCRSPSTSPSSSPASPGVYVRLEDTIRGFKEILEGKHDDLPEQAFYMVGTIEDAVAKAKKLV